MTTRRALIAIVVIAGFVASLVASRHTVVSTAPNFSPIPFASRPYASHADKITSTWYCPGVPAADATVGGEVTVTNPSDAPIRGRVTFFGPGGRAPVTQDISVQARDNLVIDVDQAMTASFVSTMVELDGGEGMVEQRALHQAGNAVTSCTTSTASTWYFADGWTVDGSTESLIITNPSADNVRVDIAFYTKAGVREPAAFQGDSIDPHSVKVINVAESQLVDETTIGVKVVATGGRLLVGRAQHYIGGNRLGYSLMLGAPAPSDQLWFAEGETGPGITEQYVVFNPTDEAALVQANVLGVPVTADFVDPEPIEVPAGKVVTFDMNTVAGLPQGRHTTVFATLAEPSVVIERVMTKPAGDTVATSVVMGMTSEYVVPRWYLPIGVDAPVEEALVIYNPFNTDTTITVNAIGPGGEVAVPGSDSIPLPASAIRTIDLTDPSVVNRPLVVVADQGVFVERLLPRGASLSGRSESWALPECGPCSLLSPPS
jgi:Family of unknown function (DUF5719)